MYYHNLISVSRSANQQLALTYYYHHSFTVHGHLASHALNYFGLLFSFFKIPYHNPSSISINLYTSLMNIILIRVR